MIKQGYMTTKGTTSRGLGDTVEKFTQATGIKKMVEKISNGKDCGCGARKDALNRMFPYKNKK
jgi:hypothetical protein